MASATEMSFISSMCNSVVASIDKLATQSAEANEAASKGSEDYREAMRKHHEKMLEHLRETSEHFDFLNT